MGDVTIRTATLDDAEAIAAIHVASWQHAYRGVLPDEYLATLAPGQRLPMWRRVLESPRPGVQVSVAEMDGAVVGFSSIGPSNEGDPADVMMLFTIYLDPGSMGQGIGRALIADAERRMRAQGATSGVLRVLTANAPTLAFYERCGWSSDPASVRLEDAWGQQVETIRYRKRLG
jgi:GNAT superfamily N-acetyltransferase